MQPDTRNVRLFTNKSILSVRVQFVCVGSAPRYRASASAQRVPPAGPGSPEILAENIPATPHWTFTACKQTSQNWFVKNDSSPQVDVSDYYTGPLWVRKKHSEMQWPNIRIELTEILTHTNSFHFISRTHPFQVIKTKFSHSDHDTKQTENPKIHQNTLNAEPKHSRDTTPMDILNCCERLASFVLQQHFVWFVPHHGG